MLGQKCGREMFEQRRAPALAREYGGEKIAVQILADVAARFVIAHAAQAGVEKPVEMTFRQSERRNEFRATIQTRSNAADCGLQTGTKFIIERTVSHPRRLLQREHRIAPCVE